MITIPGKTSLLTRLMCVLLFLAIAKPSLAQNSPLLKCMTEELEREMKEFEKADVPPYFISYRINDIESAHLRSSFGSLVLSTSDRARILRSQVRVGDYDLDNTHPLENNEFSHDAPYGHGVRIPSDDSSPFATKLLIWQSTQLEYRLALEKFKSIKTSPFASSQKNFVHDFSTETPLIHHDEPLAPFERWFDKGKWEEDIKEFSLPFVGHDDIVAGEVSMDVSRDRKYFVSTEGTSLSVNQTGVYLYISASIRAADGDILPLNQSYFAFTPDDLPPPEVIVSDVSALIEKLKKLKTAPFAEPYTGPAILLSQTAGVFFHEIFGHRIEGHRLKNDFDGQTFKAKVKEQVLPKTLNVVFDPTLREHRGVALNGHYRFDDEGVAGQRVEVVEKGVLKTFLMSRTPLEHFSQSNGHGRCSPGAEPVSRQSNLLVETSRPVSLNDLRKLLIRECSRQGKKYGYLFQNVIGGFTHTDRYNPNAFNIFPTEVYRVYVDGRPDELVKGVDLIGTPLSMFAEIQAAGDDPGVFTGFCGAESGSVPVSAVSPSLFVRRIETQKKPKVQSEAMLLPRPKNETP